MRAVVGLLASLLLAAMSAASVPAPILAQTSLPTPSPGPMPAPDEDFESGRSALPWRAHRWRVTEEASRSGRYSVRSSPIGDGDRSVLELTLDVRETGDIRFFTRSSSAPGDALDFFLDGTWLGGAGGDEDWKERVFPVPAGRRRFRWTYTKDARGKAGADTVYLDSIYLPPHVLPAAPTPAPPPW